MGRRESAGCSRLAYISFDNVPAPKGASTHIEAFAVALAQRFGEIELVTAAPGPEPAERLERWPGVFHTEFPASGRTLIDRVLCFRAFLRPWLETHTPEVIQFRSIFEGYPLLRHACGARLIFEVNGLPSVELKYRYPAAAEDRELMHKLLAQERECLEAADLIVTPSGVTRQYLATARGVDAAKIRVIPNGVDPALFRIERERSRRGPFRLVYFGTLAPWQGVELGIRALEQIRAEVPAELAIIGTGTRDDKDSLAALAAKLGLSQHVALLPAMSRAELAVELARADAVIAPLVRNDRNVLQGCCPLKVLEGMAAGAPVIASELPVVRELGCDGVHFLLAKAGSVDQIAEAALRLARDPVLAESIGCAARDHVLANFTWESAGRMLACAYEELGISRSMTA